MLTILIKSNQIKPLYSNRDNIYKNIELEHILSKKEPTDLIKETLGL